MDNISNLGRIDRAIAENLPDLRSSFGDYSGLALDFIVFISQRIKIDLFGYTRFTLQDFCEATGRERATLARKLPEKYLEIHKPHIQDGYTFDTVFENLLVQLMKTNLLFNNVYTTNEGNREVHMTSIQILMDVKLNYDRTSNELKQFEVRLGPQLLDGFIKRYYTVDTNAYKLAGKVPRGKENRQAVVVYLSVLRHVLLSQNKNVTTKPLQVISHAYLDGKGKEPFRQKEMVNRVLTSIRDKAKFPYDFKFVSGKKGYEYLIEFTFHPVYSKASLLREHNFYYELMEALRLKYATKYPEDKLKSGTDNNKDPFQDWLVAGEVDFLQKIELIRRVYTKHFDIKLSIEQAMNLYLKGFIG